MRLISTSIQTACVALLLGTLPAAATAQHTHGHEHGHGHGHDEHRTHGAHVHGIAELNVVVDADSLLVELNSPAANLVGFEHAPRTEAQRTALAQARGTLEDGAKLFVPNPEAECVQISHMTRLQPEADAATEPDVADAHADAHGEWAFTCGKPASLVQLDVRLFEAFPGTERLRVQLVTSAEQRGTELTPERHLLDL